ncbi:MAG: glycosyltransferase [Candidatus Rokubacteria bacterium]|nr:glycosyltransferase [Candidatus Rokubacteria bacterium]
MTRTVLMIAFHFPPYAGSSSVHRTARFAQHLPASGWKTVVLTADRRAYPRTDWGQYRDALRAIPVARAFALDAARHLAIGGRYLRSMALPDRWVSWWPGAVLTGDALARAHRPSLIWSTYPIATAHLVGLALHRRTGLPWVAEFRDPMIDGDYPANARVRRLHSWIERRIAARAAALVFTTPSARQAYLARHSAVVPERCHVIPNGYDEEDFTGAAAHPTGAAAHPTGAAAHRAGVRPVRLLHAGVIYPQERDPRPFFTALSMLKHGGRLAAQGLMVDLRAPGSDAHYAAVLQGLGIDDVVRLLPPVPHPAALADCAEADALLLMQGPSCNHQIPAKAYEYLRVGRPILALTPAEGDTARLLAETGGSTVVDIDDVDAMGQALPRFLDSVRQGTHPLPDAGCVRRYERARQARNLAACFDRLLEGCAAAPVGCAAAPVGCAAAPVGCAAAPGRS